MKFAVKLRALALVMVFIATFTTTTTVAADENNGWYVEGQYTAFNISEDGDSVDLNGIGLVVGRDFSENFAVEIVAGVGAGDDSLYGVKIEVDRYYGLILKPNMDVSEKISIFLDLGYVDLQLKASGPGGKFTNSSSEFLWGVGAEVDFNDSIYGSIGYTDIDTSDGIQLGIGYRF